jgi:hypothetical protein
MEVSMKKQTVVLLIIIPIILLLTISIFAIRRLAGAPSLFTMRWQTVYVNGVGSFRVPTEWYVEQQNEVIYITDKPREYEDYTLFIVGVVQIRGVASTYRYPHELFENIEKGNIVRGINFANTSGIRVFEYIVDENTIEMRVIYMIHIRENIRNMLNLLIWDEGTVDERLATEIARTFSMSQ